MKKNRKISKWKPISRAMIPLLFIVLVVVVVMLGNLYATEFARSVNDEGIEEREGTPTVTTPTSRPTPPSPCPLPMPPTKRPRQP